MFQCNYCSAEFKEHQTTCPRCGALIKATPVAQPASAPAPTPNNASAIRALCTKYDGTHNLYLVDDAIDPKRLATAREAFNIPANETVIMLYDDTLVGSNDKGFAIGVGGLYWHNSWSTTSRRTFLAWPDFAERTLDLKDLQIQLGRGDQIGVASVGDDTARANMLALLNEIKGLFQNG